MDEQDKQVPENEIQEEAPPVEPLSETETDDKDAGKKEPMPPALKIALGIGVAVLLVALLFKSHIICFHGDVSQATCTNPPICKICGKEMGEPDSSVHDWIGATCTEPKRCVNCGATEGEPLGHNVGEWKIDETDFKSAKQTSTLACSVCDEIVDTKSEPLSSFVANGKFMFSPSDFEDMVEEELSSISGVSLSAKSKSDDDGFSIGITGDSIFGGVIMFSEEGGGGETIGSYIMGDKKYSNGVISSVILAVDLDNSEAASKVILSVVDALDPSLSFDEAKDVAKAVLDDGTVKNGLKYASAKSGDTLLATIRVL